MTTMRPTNYHTHTLFCDGRASMETFVRFALSRRFSSLGFSSHAPLPFSTSWTMEWDFMETYLAEFRRLRERYASRIELYVGLEIDYLNDHSCPASDCYRLLPLDYRIGSVHLLYTPEGQIVDIDTSPGHFRHIVDRHFHGDLDLVIRLYYQRLLRLVELGGFDILGHADKMHYNASCYRPGLLDEPWYDQLVRHYFAAVARQGYLVEVNTKSYADTGTFFPNERYFQTLRQLGVRVVVNSDAHYPDRIDASRPEALRALWQAGYREGMELHAGRWVACPLTAPEQAIRGEQA